MSFLHAPPSSLQRTQLILGGQKSGKSRHAETLAQRWLQADAQHQAVLLATALPADAHMQARIARHQQERAQRAPRLRSEHVPLHLAQALRRHSQAQTLLVIDCLTLWLTNWLMPPPDAEKYIKNMPQTQDWQGEVALFLEALSQTPGPVVLVGNEIGQGVIPLSAQVRDFVDALGVLNQQVAQVCDVVTWMVAGCPLQVKGGAA